MGGRWIIALQLVFAATGMVRSVPSLDFNISTTWNGAAITDHAPVQLTLTSADPKYLDLQIVAPFFNDPKPDGAAGMPFFGLWEYEVVEAFFLNDDDQYLEVEVSPHGQHIVLLLNGQRVTIRHSLPLNVTTNIDQTKGLWTGLAKIPVSYLPRNVSRFNAYAIHGLGDARQYWSLYPADHTATAPDFHALKYFDDIDLSGLLPSHAAQPMSQLWTDAITGVFRYEIATTWDGEEVDHFPAQITLQGFEAGVEMNVTAPFFNDPKPEGDEGAFYGLWDYEVVEMFFLNDDDEYLEVELGPWGHHLLLLLNGRRNAIKHSLALDYVAARTNDAWTGSALIPPEYFPPKVTRVNAYAIHGTGANRTYQALYPAPRNSPGYTQPDFHALELFQPIDFEYQLPNNSAYSDVWRAAMGGGASPVVKDAEEVEVTTSLGFFDWREDDALPTTLEPELEDTTLLPETSMAPASSPRTVATTRAPATTTEDPATTTEAPVTTMGIDAPTREVRPEERLPRPTATSPGTSAHRSDLPEERRRGSVRHRGSVRNRGTVRYTPRPQRVDAFQPPRGQRRDDVQPGAWQPPRPRPQRVRGHFQDRVLVEPQQPQFPRRGQFQDDRRPLPPVQERPQFFQDERQQPPFQNFQDERPQPPFQNFQDERPQPPFQNFQDERPQPPFRNFQDERQQQPFQNFQDERPQQPFQNFQDERPQQPFQNFQDERPHQFFPDDASEPVTREEDARPPFQSPAPQDNPAFFSPPLVTPGEQVATPEVQDALEALAESTPSFPPPHPICFEPGLVPDSNLCYAFHECVYEGGEWQVFSWRCEPGKVYDPVNVQCVRGRCVSSRRRG